MQKKIILLIVIGFCYSCTGNKKLPDVSNIKVAVTIHRFDNDFFDTTIPSVEKLPAMQLKYGNLFDYYLSKTFITDNLQNGVSPANAMDGFINGYKPLYDSTQLLYKDLGWLQTTLQKDFKYYKYYFPNYNIPQIFTIVDGFYTDNPQSYYGVEYDGKDTLVVSLQMFLGKNFSGYNPEFYFDYLKEKFTKNYIVKNIFTTLLQTKIDNKKVNNTIAKDTLNIPLPTAPNNGNTLIEAMVQVGKLTYILNKVMPTETEAVALGYTPQQLKQCFTNEKEIWSHFVNANNLFTNEATIIKEYVGESPYTKAFGMDSPGNIGAFVGWRIVQQYMDSHTNITLPQLLQTDNKIVYTEAKYKPN